MLLPVGDHEIKHSIWNALAISHKICDCYIHGSQLLYLTDAKPNQYLEKSYVPFKYQEEFARDWWVRYSEKFKKLGFAWKGGWLYDAIIDGNNLTLRYDQLTEGSSDTDSWTRAVLEQLIQKK